MFVTDFLSLAILSRLFFIMTRQKHDFAHVPSSFVRVPAASRAASGRVGARSRVSEEFAHVGTIPTACPAVRQFHRREMKDVKTVRLSGNT